jgi:opacity protein-like surface antigen
MKRVFLIGVLFVGSLMASAVPAAAQNLNVDLGYQWQRLSADDDSVSFPVGFSAAVAGALPNNPNLSILGQIDWSRKSEEEFGFEETVSVVGFGAGARWSFTTNPSMTPFVQGVIGAVRYSEGGDFGDFSDTNMAIQFGGGVAFPLSGNISGLGQVDYRRIFSEGQGTNSIRIVAGIRIGL